MPHATQRLLRLIALALALPSAAHAQTTALTYQGQLKSSGSPVDGAYDMAFAVFDADVAGNQVGPTLTFDGQGGNPPQVSVAGGLFTSRLDFGAGVFDGNPRWLEVTVGGETLTPRQEITSAPYAQTAAFAATAAYATSSGSSGPWLLNGLDAYYNDGKVGVGTSSPTEPFSLRTATNSYGFSHSDGTINLASFVGGGGNGGYIGTKSNHSLHFYANDSDPLMTVHPNRNVGIGTINPTAKLHVAASSGNTIYGTTSGGRGVAGWATSNFGGIGVSGDHVPSGNYGYLGSIDAGVTGVAQVSVNYGGSFINTDPGGIALRSQGLLDIVASGNGTELLRFNTERPWSFRQIGSGSGSFLQLKSSVGLKNFEITAAGGTNVATFWADDANPRLVVNGMTSTKVLQVTGADLAEKFPTSCGTVEPGTVMEIDPENAGHLRMARGVYNQRVAGVVSGANDFPAGAILGNLVGNEEAPPIALSGRVWTYCDAREAAIRPGDLLTSSATAGHAMKAVDRERSHGAIIGKAMTALKSGKGLVLVLVNLQ